MKANNPISTIPKKELQSLTRSFLKLTKGEKKIIPIEISFSLKVPVRIRWQEDFNSDYDDSELDPIISNFNIDHYYYDALGDAVGPFLDQKDKEIEQWNKELGILCATYQVNKDEIMGMMVAADEEQNKENKIKQVSKLEKQIQILQNQIATLKGK
jgi:hypothetical protein